MMPGHHETNQMPCLIFQRLVKRIFKIDLNNHSDIDDKERGI
jgi:hypothetical protein